VVLQEGAGRENGSGGLSYYFGVPGRELESDPVPFSPFRGAIATLCSFAVCGDTCAREAVTP